MTPPRSLGNIAMLAYFEYATRKDSWEAAAQAVLAEAAKWPKCDRCNGAGTISERRGTSYETDSAEERAACWYDVRCPACGGLGRAQP